jgi:hypothetical protein
VFEETTRPVNPETGKEMIDKFRELSINYLKIKEIKEFSTFKE